MSAPVSLIAKKSLRYAGVAYAAGEAFQARDAADAAVLKLARLADDAPIKAKVMEPEPAPEPVAEPVAEPVVEPESLPEPVIEPDTALPVTEEPASEANADTPDEPRKRRTYRRRDMQPDSE